MNFILLENDMNSSIIRFFFIKNEFLVLKNDYLLLRILFLILENTIDFLTIECHSLILEIPFLY